MFATRLDALPTDARRVLETLAICGRPMASDLVCDASGVSRERQSLLAMLRGARFIRSSGSSERIETYHDRIRDVLAASVAPEAVRGIHSRMVQALVGRQSDDCEALFDHYRGAGDAENASIQAGLAGGKAGAALAFDRSASFYQHALALSPASPHAHAGGKGSPPRSPTPAGRPRPPRPICGAAAEAGDPQRVELQRRGAEQFLIGGHIDRGLDLIHTMLANMGMRVPASPRAALLPLLWRRARLRWRGLALRAESRRGHRCGYAAAPRHLLVGGDGSAARGHDRRGGLQRPPPAHCARRRRTVPSRSGAGDRSGRQGDYPTGRTLVPRLVQQSRTLAQEVGHPHAIALCRPVGRHDDDGDGRMEEGPGALRGGADHPARPVRGRHLGGELGAEPRDLGAHVSGRARRAVAPGAARFWPTRGAAGTSTSRPSCARAATISGSRQTSPTKGSVSRSRASGGGRTRGFTASTTVRCWRASRPRSIVATPTRRGACSPNWRSSFAVRRSRAFRSCGSSRSTCGRAARWPWPRAMGPTAVPPGRPFRSPADRQRADAVVGPDCSAARCGGRLLEGRTARAVELSPRCRRSLRPRRHAAVRGRRQPAARHVAGGCRRARSERRAEEWMAAQTSRTRPP